MDLPSSIVKRPGNDLLLTCTQKKGIIASEEVHADLSGSAASGKVNGELLF